jgi:F420-dependent oxidoreductase-like protein
VGETDVVELRIFLEPQQGATYEQQLVIAQAAERLGFDGFFRSDHFVTFGGGDGLPGPTDAWVTLAGIARETERIRLGTMVTCGTFRWPGVLAISVAQVDVMSAGRVELGLGAGWNEREHKAYGVPFWSLGQRMDRLEEQLEIITGLWETAEGKTFTYCGQHYELIDSPALPKPVQSPRPPIIVGGGGKKRTPQLAAKYADEFNVPFHPLDAAREQIERVRQACDKEKRDPDSLIYSAALCTVAGIDAAEVDRRAANIGRTRDNVDLAGTPDEIAGKLGAWKAAGITRIYLQVLDMDDLEHFEVLAELIDKV